MMEIDRCTGESISLVVDGQVIRIELVKSEKNKARIAIDAPAGTVMYRNERLAAPIEKADFMTQAGKTAN